MTMGELKQRDYVRQYGGIVCRDQKGYPINVVEDWMDECEVVGAGPYSRDKFLIEISIPYGGFEEYFLRSMKWMGL